MKVHDAIEQAYKNGYEAGKRFHMVFEHCPNCGRKLRGEEDG